MQKICCILIWRIFQLILLSSSFPVSFGVSTKCYYGNSYRTIVYITYYQEYCISCHASVDIDIEVLIFHADKFMVIGNSKNSCDTVILLKS